MRGIRALLEFFVYIPIGGVVSFFIWLAIIGIGIQIASKAMFGVAEPSQSFALASPWALVVAILGTVYAAYIYYQARGELMREGVRTITAIILSGMAVLTLLAIVVWAFSSSAPPMPSAPPEVPTIRQPAPPIVEQPSKPAFQPAKTRPPPRIDRQDETYCLNVIQRAKARYGRRWRQDLSREEQVRCWRQTQEYTP
jgi:hypothetical protein